MFPEAHPYLSLFGVILSGSPLLGPFSVLLDYVSVGTMVLFKHPVLPPELFLPIRHLYFHIARQLICLTQLPSDSSSLLPFHFNSSVIGHAQTLCASFLSSL